MVRDHERCVRCGTCAESCPEGAMEIIGRKVCADEIVERVARDRSFFERSGGGVTLSGGEPTTQPDFLLGLLRGFQAQGIHCALETCGLFPTSLIERLLPQVDLFLFDLKHTDPDAHRRETARSNVTILKNLHALVSRGAPRQVVLRIPLVPGFNTAPLVLQALLDIASGAGYSGPLHLMPYNRLIRTKYEKLGRQSDYKDRPALTEPQLLQIRRQVESSGFEAVINH